MFIEEILKTRTRMMVAIFLTIYIVALILTGVVSFMVH